MAKAYSDHLSAFTPATLEDAIAMAFLNRFDTKYVLKTGDITDFLENIRSGYSVLQIKNIVAQDYKTVYFDTPDLLCFNMHHSGKRSRYKFRTRKYMSSGDIYNEIKHRRSTGKIYKIRQRRNGTSDCPSKPVLPAVQNLSDYDEHFVSLLHGNGYSHIGELKPALNVYFTRATFLNKSFPERMTLDYGLSFEHNGVRLNLPETAIIELKREKGPEKTVSQNYLQSINRRPSGFSKYMTGVALTHDNAKICRCWPRITDLVVEKKN